MKKFLKIVLLLAVIGGCKTPNFAIENPSFEDYYTPNPDNKLWADTAHLWNYQFHVDTGFTVSLLYDTIPAVLCTADTSDWMSTTGNVWKRVTPAFGACWWEFGYVLKSNVFYNDRYLNNERYLNARGEPLDSNIVVLSWKVRKGYKPQTFYHLGEMYPTSNTQIFPAHNDSALIFNDTTIMQYHSP